MNKYWGDDSWRNAAYAEPRQNNFFGPELVKQGNEVIVAWKTGHRTTRCNRRPTKRSGFLSAHDQINNLFNLRRDHATAAEHRASRTQTFRVWAEICGVAAMI
jgi:hypothetical protein